MWLREGVGVGEVERGEVWERVWDPEGCPEGEGEKSAISEIVRKEELSLVELVGAGGCRER